ncbi:hypothetical protein ACFLTH_06835 [Bacteroidota bacterium]
MKTKYISMILFISLSKLLVAQDFDFFEPKSEIGGYGELHYNQESSDGNQTTKTLDFHRFVLFYSHSWSEKWSFKAEVEMEHNFVGGDKGELELEQAYVNYHHADWFGFQAGVVLPSVGLINEIHEPPTFLSVERSDYNKNIIPTTWFGNGASIYGNLEGFDYKFTVMEGFNSDNFSANNGIRSGRQKGYKADATNLLYNARVNYTNIPGLLVGASITYNKAKGDTTETPFTLMEVHARVRKNNIYIDAEYGSISYSEGTLEKSAGYYVDLGYNVANLFNCKSRIVPFVRYSNVNTASVTSTGGDSEKEFNNSYLTFGLSFIPIEEVTFKVDYTIVENDLTGKETKLFNLGVGYMF